MSFLLDTFFIILILYTNKTIIYINHIKYNHILSAYIIKHFAEESVLDLFGGTGTTLIACEQLGKKGYTMELEPKYCQIIIDRWEQYTGNKAIKIN